jgi:hypothetical protein
MCCGVGREREMQRERGSREGKSRFRGIRTLFSVEKGQSSFSKIERGGRTRTSRRTLDPILRHQHPPHLRRIKRQTRLELDVPPAGTDDGLEAREGGEV